MDKFFLRYVAVCLVLLLAANLARACNMATTSDEKIMNDYIAVNYDEKCYGTLEDYNDDDYIDFVIHKADGSDCNASISREFYQNIE